MNIDLIELAVGEKINTALDKFVKKSTNALDKLGRSKYWWILALLAALLIAISGKGEIGL